VYLRGDESAGADRRAWAVAGRDPRQIAVSLQDARGEEIPLAGRITAIADTFYALVSRRVYKAPVPLDRALAVIEEGRCKQFDPQLVDLFLDCRGDVAAIVADHPDR
jgi:HD-GYP domain-containing protein (c-di-GMP phosphodiesterase class II)